MSGIAVATGLAVALAAIGVLLVGAGISTSHHTATAEIVECMDSDMREQARVLMLAGIDQALKEHTAHMFDTWMKDRSDQPKRAIVGMQVGVSAYVRSRAAAKRWNPPNCKETGP